MLDAERFYDEYQKGSLGSDTIWFEMIALSTRSSKLRKLLAENQSKVYQVVKEFLKTQIERGFLREDINIDVIAHSSHSALQCFPLSNNYYYKQVILKAKKHGLKQ